MMLGQMVCMETKPIIGLNEAQPLLDLLLERHAGIVHVLEDTELHVFSSPNTGLVRNGSHAPRPVPRLILSFVCTGRDRKSGRNGYRPLFVSACCASEG